MADPNWAAFDPLFWAQHAMVDRLWRIWQHNRPGAQPDHALLDQPMTYATEPSLRARDVLDVKQLAYPAPAASRDCSRPFTVAKQLDAADSPGPACAMQAASWSTASRSHVRVSPVPMSCQPDGGLM